MVKKKNRIMNLRFRFTKKHFLCVFYGVIAVLFIIKLFCPDITKGRQEGSSDSVAVAKKPDSIDINRQRADSILSQPRAKVPFEFNSDGSLKKHRIYSVSDFSEAFPDSNHVQLATAERLGVKPVKDREQAEHRKDELVYVGSNPYFHVKKLYSSIPYLIPPAAVLLEHIGRTFQDSLAVKGIPLNTIIVTSLLRTEYDVDKLRRHNGNASSQSCHRFGTTFDISYNKYVMVQDPDAPRVRPVRNDTLKWVLSEVLNDARRQGLCYVKYERKQGCYHITVR